jgi:hypothetical protein
MKTMKEMTECTKLNVKEKEAVEFKAMSNETFE